MSGATKPGSRPWHERPVKALALLRREAQCWRRYLYLSARREQVAQAVSNELTPAGLTNLRDEFKARLTLGLSQEPASISAILREHLDRTEVASSWWAMTYRRTLPEFSTHIVSMGTHCFTSAMLARWGCRRWSGPFDWLFSSADVIAHCLEDDFQTFLNPAQYEPVPVELRAAGPSANRVHHRYYREAFGIEHLFNHHDVHLPEDYAHFVRAVDRFRRLLESRSPKLFLMTRWHQTTDVEDLERLRQILSTRTSNHHLMVVAVRDVQGAPAPSLKCEKELPDMSAWVYEPMSRWEPLRFPDLVDEAVLIRLVLRRARELEAHAQA